MKNENITKNNIQMFDVMIKTDLSISGNHILCNKILQS